MPRSRRGDSVSANDTNQVQQCIYPSFDRFDPNEEKFGSYLERFQFYVDAYNIPDEKWKSILITCLGPSTYSQLRKLTVPETPQSLSFEELTAKLTNFFQPTPLPATERHKLRNRKQQPGEPFSDFLADLQAIAMNCGFQSQSRIEEEIRDQIISGVSNTATQSYFLQQSTLSLSQVVAKGLADEQASLGISCLQKGGKCTLMGVCEVEALSWNKTQKNVGNVRLIFLHAEGKNNPKEPRVSFWRLEVRSMISCTASRNGMHSTTSPRRRRKKKQDST